MKGQTYHPPAGRHARAVPFPLSKRPHHVELPPPFLLASALGAVLILILAAGVTARD